MEQQFYQTWIRRSLFSLVVVAFLGTLMRYKIGFSLPWVEQKNILNAHSHFAFAGWLTQILMVLMVRYLALQRAGLDMRKYNTLLWANLLTAYGMVLSFPFLGYTFIPILLSTLSLFASYAFAVVFWRDLNRLPVPHISHHWFKAALLWNVISSIGPFYLAYMLANHDFSQHRYLGAIYYFLHFQYNGWFFFACAGLLYSGNEGKGSAMRYIFWLFALSCLPAYLLSILWAHLPRGLFGFAYLAALMQLVGWGALLSQIRKKRIFFLHNMARGTRTLFILAAVAGSAKFLMQGASLHPVLRKIAFGFRPIIIGYLHLVLLGLLTMFVLAFLKQARLMQAGGARKLGIIVFITGILIQEILLFTQGGMAMVSQSVPYMNEGLFGAAVVMLCGTILLFAGFARQSTLPAGAYPTPENTTLS